MVSLMYFPFTDLGNSERLISLHGHELRYCHPQRRWYTWDGTRWNPNLPEEVGKRACLTVRAMFAEASSLLKQAERAETDEKAKSLAEQAEKYSKFARASEARARIVAMVDGARDHLAIKPEELDRDPDLLNCKNGTLHLPSGELRPHNQADFITKMAPVAYDPAAKLPLWELFLEEALPDPAVREYTQQTAGPAISGRQYEDAVTVCQGAGGTGKTSFLEAIKGSLGDYAAACDISTFTTEGKAHGAQPDLARLAGKRLVVVWEAESGGSTVKLLKAATGADTISARHLFQETFEFQPTFSLWLRANKRPRLPHDDTGLWRRVKEIPFETVFENPDPKIRETLKNPDVAGPAVLAWLVEGYRKYLEAGRLVVPEAVAKATAEFRDEMDSFKEWYEECTQAAPPTASILFKTLWESYRRHTGRRPGLGRGAFRNRLLEMGLNVHNGTGNAVHVDEITLAADYHYQQGLES